MSKSNTGSETDDGAGLTESPDRPGVYRTKYDPDGTGTVTDTVIQAIAEVAEVDPTNTVIPLADRIDPDALNSLFADREGNAQTTFRVCGLEVLVRSDGRVRIVDDSVSDTD
ncbi:HalOD1 output domain-containing protein [Halorussus lipolyticus]|uniref:HalOD1 output domain-containing protein n=1 Tax=Halorussus lipolyticus TaxID=3034024 RepID=UPI0023E8FBC1|nr:HalOD1 output domain-containing protein [Halorussus sp. DT80]